MKSRKKKKRSLVLIITKLSLVIILLVLFSIALARLVYYSSCVYKTQDYKMYLTVGNNLGFDVNQSYLHFGKVIRGGSSEKEVNITNDLKIPIKIKIKLEGDFINWLYIRETNNTNFTLAPGEMANLHFVVKVPENASFGNYSGKLSIIFSKC